MGAIHGKRIEIVSTIGEIVGYKSGLALSREQLSEDNLQLALRSFADAEPLYVRGIARLSAAGSSEGLV